MNALLAAALAALVTAPPGSGAAEEVVINAAMAKEPLKTCLPAMLARWQGYRPRLPGADPDLVDYDQPDMKPAYRLRFTATPEGVAVRARHHVPVEPLAAAIRDCEAAQAK